jgi:gamma-glutamyl phosphate reductase
MEIKIIAKTENGIEGLHILEKNSRGMILRRLIRTKWLDEKETQIQITNQIGVQMQNSKKVREDMKNRLKIYLSTICKLSENDYRIEE